MNKIGSNFMNYSQSYQTSTQSSTPIPQITNTSGSFNWSSTAPSNVMMLWRLIYIRTYCKKTDHYNCNLKDNNNLAKL